MSRDINDLELAGLSEAELAELSEFIDPDNELLPASDRLPPHTRRKPTGPYDRQHLIQHLKKQADESKVGEDYVPFVKKPPKEPQPQVRPQQPKRAAKTDFDDMLDMLDPDDLTELAAELGLHGLIDQAESRGDHDHPIAALPGAGLQAAGYSYTPPASKYSPEADIQETDIEESISSLESDDPFLTDLNLNNHTKVDSSVLDQIIEAMVGNTHLKTLSMANVRFSEDHAKALAGVLRTNTSLTVLNLESNRITRKGIAAIMKALAENPQTSLKELRLANQYFAGGAGAEADIAKHLEKITSIVRLGYIFTSPSVRTRIDRFIMRNTDLIRQKRASLTV